MSLREALERVEKLKRMAASANPHEAAVAAGRLNAFDVHAARAPWSAHSNNAPDAAAPLANTDGSASPHNAVSVLDDWPVIPFSELGDLDVEQPSGTPSVNWDVLHAELLERAHAIGAHAVLNIRIGGTIRQKVLTGTALKYLTPREILDRQAANKLDDDEHAHREAQKERRDEEWAPPVG